MDTDLVSVYLPTYNRLELLRRAVTSVLDQSYRNLELLIVDDGSTDGTCVELDALCERLGDGYLKEHDQMSLACYERLINSNLARTRVISRSTQPFLAL